MSDKTLLKRVNELKILETQRKVIDKQMEAIQDAIKAELEARGQEEAQTGDWIVRFKEVISNKFNSKAFATDHPRLYQKYMTPSQTKRFTVNAQG